MAKLHGDSPELNRVPLRAESASRTMMAQMLYTRVGGARLRLGAASSAPQTFRQLLTVSSHSGRCRSCGSAPTRWRASCCPTPRGSGCKAVGLSQPSIWLALLSEPSLAWLAQCLGFAVTIGTGAAAAAAVPTPQGSDELQALHADGGRLPHFSQQSASHRNDASLPPASTRRVSLGQPPVPFIRMPTEVDGRAVKGAALRVCRDACVAL